MTRYGIVGCGGIGRLRVRALHRSPNADLAAVCDLDETLARASATGDTRVAPDWKALVADDDIDVVIVSTPPSSHAEIAIAALRAGHHVLVEKPLARSSAECRAIQTEADRAGRSLFVGFNYRFYPSVVRSREWLDAGAIGELDHIRAYAGYPATDLGHAWLKDPEVMGGGALRDTGIHLLDLVGWFLGGNVTAQGLASDRVWRFDGCEDNGFLLLQSDEGRVASVQASWTEWRGYRFRLELYGTEGCIIVSCFPMIARLVPARKKGGRGGGKRAFFPYTHAMERLRSYTWVVEESFIAEFASIEAALSGRAAVVASGLDGIRTVELAEAAIDVGPRRPPAGDSQADRTR